jgi:hypothetical protein
MLKWVEWSWAVSGKSFGDRGLRPLQSILYRVRESRIGAQCCGQFQTRWRQVMAKKDEYVATMESEIKKWDIEVDKLNAKSAELTAEARAGYDTQVKALRADRNFAFSKLEELRTANESAWDKMQSGVDAAWTTMKNALDKAAKQYK